MGAKTCKPRYENSLEMRFSNISNYRGHNCGSGAALRCRPIFSGLTAASQTQEQRPTRGGPFPPRVFDIMHHYATASAGALVALPDLKRANRSGSFSANVTIWAPS